MAGMLQYTESNRSDRNIMQAQLVMQIPMRLLHFLEATHLRGVCVCLCRTISMAIGVAQFCDFELHD